MPLMTPGEPAEEASPWLLGPVNGDSDLDSNAPRRDENVEAIRRHRLRILLADDNDLFRRGVALRLESFYHALVVEVASGRDVLHVAAAEQKFHLILIDIRMPGLDGIAAAEALRKAGIKTPIVLMSAYYSAEAKRAAEALGLVVIAKPIEGAALEKILLMCCGDLAS